MGTSEQVVGHRCPWCEGTGVDPAAPAPRTPPDDTIDAPDYASFFPKVAEAVADTLRPSLWATRDRQQFTNAIGRGLSDPRTLHPAVHQIVRQWHGRGEADKVMGALASDHWIDLSSASIIAGGALIGLVIVGETWDQQTVQLHARLTGMLLRGRGHLPTP